MRYVANPIEVEAFQITALNPPDSYGCVLCFSGDSDVWHRATPEQMARMKPQIGDYVVTQSDGYVYLNPKEVFERKYAPISRSEASIAS